MAFELERSLAGGDAVDSHVHACKVGAAQRADFFRGVSVLNHVSSIPQPTENTRKIFAVLQSIFVDDTPPLFEKKRTSV